MTNQTISPVTQEILEMFEKRGGLHYGENVTQLEHALQCAALAVEDGQSDALVVASLLHDIGHLIHGEENAAEHGEDDVHEVLGEEWLSTYFNADVCEPVRLHVEAKRYLCAVDDSYEAGLSEASRISLGLQGGPMSPEEIADFEKNEYFQEAVTLRRYDDRGKAEIEVPDLETYVQRIEKLLAEHVNA